MNTLHQTDDTPNPRVVDKGKVPMRELTPNSPQFPPIASTSRVDPILINPCIEDTQVDHLMMNTT